ncbi:MAG: hypothetical protein V4548_04875 [Bacteroidota bacterium]
MLLISSCEIPYDGEKRHVVNVRVLNSDGNPITNQYVEVNSHNSRGWFDSYSNLDLITYGKTNNQGELTLIFPSSDTTFNVNFGNYYDNNVIYLRTSLDNLRLDNFDNFKIDLNPIILYKLEELTTLTIDLVHSAPQTILRNIKVEGYTSYDPFYFNPIPIEESYYPQTEFKIVKNKNFVLTYIVKDLNTSIESTYTVSLTVANDPISYTINY